SPLVRMAKNGEARLRDAALNPPPLIALENGFGQLHARGRDERLQGPGGESVFKFRIDERHGLGGRGKRQRPGSRAAVRRKSRRRRKKKNPGQSGAPVHRVLTKRVSSPERASGSNDPESPWLISRAQWP